MRTHVYRIMKIKLCLTLYFTMFHTNNWYLPPLCCQKGIDKNVHFALVLECDSSSLRHGVNLRSQILYTFIREQWVANVIVVSMMFAYLVYDGNFPRIHTMLILASLTRGICALVLICCYSILCTVKPVYNDHLMAYFSAFWSSSRWPWFYCIRLPTNTNVITARN